MTLTKIKKAIIQASRQSIDDGIVCYIAYTCDDRVISNFIDDCTGITDDQLITLENAGLLVRDWDTLTVK